MPNTTPSSTAPGSALQVEGTDSDAVDVEAHSDVLIIGGGQAALS